VKSVLLLCKTEAKLNCIPANDEYCGAEMFLKLMYPFNGQPGVLQVFQALFDDMLRGLESGTLPCSRGWAVSRTANSQWLKFPAS
jgi:hypothetical protein